MSCTLWHLIFLLTGRLCTAIKVGKQDDVLFFLPYFLLPQFPSITSDSLITWCENKTVSIDDWLQVVSFVEFLNVSFDKIVIPKQFLWCTSIFMHYLLLSHTWRGFVTYFSSVYSFLNFSYFAAFDHLISLSNYPSFNLALLGSIQSPVSGVTSFFTRYMLSCYNAAIEWRMTFS